MVSTLNLPPITGISLQASTGISSVSSRAAGLTSPQQAVVESAKQASVGTEQTGSTNSADFRNTLTQGVETQSGNIVNATAQTTGNGAELLAEEEVALKVEQSALGELGSFEQIDAFGEQSSYQLENLSFLSLSQPNNQPDKMPQLADGPELAAINGRQGGNGLPGAVDFAAGKVLADSLNLTPTEGRGGTPSPADSLRTTTVMPERVMLQSQADLHTAGTKDTAPSTQPSNANTGSAAERGMPRLSAVNLTQSSQLLSGAGGSLVQGVLPTELDADLRQLVAARLATAQSGVSAQMAEGSQVGTQMPLDSSKPGEVHAESRQIRSRHPDLASLQSQFGRIELSTQTGTSERLASGPQPAQRQAGMEPLLNAISGAEAPRVAPTPPVMRVQPNNRAITELSLETGQLSESEVLNNAIARASKISATSSSNPMPYSTAVTDAANIAAGKATGSEATTFATPRPLSDQVMQQVMQHTSSLLAQQVNGRNNLTVQLQPRELGSITIEFEQGREMNVVIHAREAVTRDLIDTHAIRLRTALEEAGIDLGSLRVALDSRGSGQEQASNRWGGTEQDAGDRGAQHAERPGDVVQAANEAETDLERRISAGDRVLDFYV